MHITSLFFFFVACLCVCSRARVCVCMRTFFFLRVFCVCCLCDSHTYTYAYCILTRMRTCAFFALLAYTHTFARCRLIHIPSLNAAWYTYLLARSHIPSLDSLSSHTFAWFAVIHIRSISSFFSKNLHTHTRSLSSRVHTRALSLCSLLHTFAHFAFTYVHFLRSLYIRPLSLHMFAFLVVVGVLVGSVPCITADDRAKNSVDKGISLSISRDVIESHRECILSYADVCWRMLTSYADVLLLQCRAAAWRMLTYAEAWLLQCRAGGCRMAKTSSSCATIGRSLLLILRFLLLMLYWSRYATVGRSFFLMLCLVYVLYFLLYCLSCEKVV